MQQFTVGRTHVSPVGIGGVPLSDYTPNGITRGLQVTCAVLDVLGQLGALQEVQPEGRPSLTVATPAAIALPSGPTTFLNASSAILLNYSSPSPASLLPCSSAGGGTETFQSCFVSASSLQVRAYHPAAPDTVPCFFCFLDGAKSHQTHPVRLNNAGVACMPGQLVVYQRWDQFIQGPHQDV
jgi:hypothetical protein